MSAILGDPAPHAYSLTSSQLTGLSSGTRVALSATTSGLWVSTSVASAAITVLMVDGTVVTFTFGAVLAGLVLPIQCVAITTQTNCNGIVALWQ